MPDPIDEVTRDRDAREGAAAEGPFHADAMERAEHRGLATGETQALEDLTQVPGTPPPEAAGLGEERTLALTQRQLAWRRFRRHKLAMACLVLLAIITLGAIVAPLLTRYTFSEQDLTNTLQSPSWEHLFGTDTLGRDQFTRLLYGGRISLLVGIAVALSATLIGTVIGALAGFYGGRIDNGLMRVTDLFLSIPFLVILIMGSLLLGSGVSQTILVLALFFWMADARIVRGIYLSLKEKEFVEAARASGMPNRRVIFSEMLPNAIGPITVATTLSVAAAILTESVLSFLGFGIQPPTPTWGNLLDAAKNLAVSAPWLLIFPGVAITITVLCVNFIGDGLRDALDPQQQAGPV
jgi:peptide/nickel transport system permease protein